MIFNHLNFHEYKLKRFKFSIFCTGRTYVVRRVSIKNCICGFVRYDLLLCSYILLRVTSIVRSNIYVLFVIPGF